MASSIFINYRRGIDDDFTKRVFATVSTAFGPEAVFLDDSMAGGTDIPDNINRELKNCRVLVAVICRGWHNVQSDDGTLRLHAQADWVRTEIAFALENDIPVLPVLARGATMPNFAELPKDLKSLPDKKYRQLSPETWEADSAALVRDISCLAGLAAKPLLRVRVTFGAALGEDPLTLAITGIQNVLGAAPLFLSEVLDDGKVVQFKGTKPAFDALVQLHGERQLDDLLGFQVEKIEIVDAERPTVDQRRLLPRKSTAYDTNIDLRRVPELEPNTRVEVMSKKGNLTVVTYTELSDGIASFRYTGRTRVRLADTGGAWVLLRDTLILQRLFSSSVVCRLPLVKGWEEDGERLSRLLSRTTNKVKETVVVLRMRDGRLYAHSNFVAKGYAYPTKIVTYEEIDLSALLSNIVFQEVPTQQEAEQLDAAHKSSVQYIMWGPREPRRLSFGKYRGKRWPAPAGATRLQWVDEPEQAEIEGLDPSSANGRGPNLPRAMVARFFGRSGNDPNKRDDR